MTIQLHKTLFIVLENDKQEAQMRETEILKKTTKFD